MKNFDNYQDTQYVREKIKMTLCVDSEPCVLSCSFVHGEL